MDPVTWHWCTPAELADRVHECPNDYRLTPEDPSKRKTYRLADDAVIRILRSEDYRDVPATATQLGQVASAGRRCR